MALHRAGEPDPCQGPERWRELLLELARDKDSAFTLIVEDLQQPALLQPPVPEDSMAKWNIESAADGLDILVTAKNHDVKAARAVGGDAEVWFYALMTLQTMQGFLGAGNYGIARMNGGFASRPGVGFSPSRLPGPRFLRDVSAVLEKRDEIANRIGLSFENGQTLLWLLPWDGKESLSLQSCDPFFIEICRRVRLVQQNGQIVCRYTSTQCARVDAKARNGVVGDPWMPIERDGTTQKALTMSASGFSYSRTQQLLFDSSRFEPPITQDWIRADPAELLFIGQVLVRGQGKTEGLHERVVPIPGDVLQLLGTPEGTALLEEHARERVEAAGLMARKVLRPALATLLQGGRDKLKLDDGRVRELAERFDRLVDSCFFESLFATLRREEQEEVDPMAEWKRQLVAWAREVLDEAIATLPLQDARHYRSMAMADRVFWGAAYNNQFIQPEPNRSAQTEEAAL
jgi:CRISPR system Cascade subunit CasA